jgi:GNAT superfamily N-acetyltransferase
MTWQLPWRPFVAPLELPLLPESVDLTMRPATAEDHEHCAEIYLEARARAVADNTMPVGIHPDAEVRQWMRDVVLPGREVWLASAADDSAVGLLVLDRAWLDSLYVRPAWWGRGVASALVTLAKALRPDGFSLWVFEVNAPARRLYERHGLSLARRTDGSDNEEGAPDLEYVWRPGGDMSLVSK